MNVAAGSVESRVDSEIKELVEDGQRLQELIHQSKPGHVFPVAAKFHSWYTRSLSVVRALLPDRLDEFRRQYERDAKRKVVDPLTYVLDDYLHGLQAPMTGDVLNNIPAFQINDIAFLKLNTQIRILESARHRLTDLLANIRGVLQADLFDSELAAARHLFENGHLRAAGAVAGVVLESHLSELCERHGLKIGRKDPHIADFNEKLKSEGILDIPNWRWIQRLADIRNLCDHKKLREPTTAEVDELLTGVDKAIKILS